MKRQATQKPEINGKLPPNVKAYIYALERKLATAEDMVSILHSTSFFAHATRREKLDEMKRMSSDYSVHRLSRALRVPTGTYYNDVLRAKGEDAWYNLRIKELEDPIRNIYETSHGVYGSGMITKILRRGGNPVAQRTVQFVMGKLGLRSSRNTAGRAFAARRRKLENLLKHNEDEFTAAKPNSLWVCDVTELVYRNSKCYLCAILDVFSRKVVGAKISPRNSTRLVKATFLCAIETRKPKTGLVFHSDRGSTNLSRRMADTLRQHGVVQSVSRPHIPQDNAVIESFFRNLKTEVVYPCKYNSLAKMINGVMAYINYYNAERPHSFNKGKTPNEVETEFCANSLGNDTGNAQG